MISLGQRQVDKIYDLVVNQKMPHFKVAAIFDIPDVSLVRLIVQIQDARVKSPVLK